MTTRRSTISIPTTAVLPTELILADVVTDAMRNRPEIAQVGGLRRGAELDERYAKREAKPKFDLNLSVAENGFAGALSDPATNPDSNHAIPCFAYLMRLNGRPHYTAFVDVKSTGSVTSLKQL